MRNQEADCVGSSIQIMYISLFEQGNNSLNVEKVVREYGKVSKVKTIWGIGKVSFDVKCKRKKKGK